MTNQTAFFSAGSAARANAIETRRLTFRWPGQTDSITFPDLTLARGEHLFLHGPSGTGKSTLLSLLAGLQAPETGSVRLLGQDFSNLRPGRRDHFRANHMGVIFQQFNLVPYLSAMGNVTLPCALSASRRDRTRPEVNTTASLLLEQLAIPEAERHRNVTTLSIGQQQRVAAARALIGAPEIILADEPTSALDTDNRDRFLDLLLTLASEQQSSVVFVSHDRALARHFHQQAALGDPA